MKKVFKSLPILLLTMALFSISPMNTSADLPAYKLFDKDCDRTDWDDLVDDAMEADIILFGELHNNPICHWLELELTKAVYKEMKDKKNFVLGAEMFETDDQLKLDEYLAGIISESNFEKEAKLWNNYKTDYKPLVKFAKDSGLKFIGTNIPRRYAAVVAKKGVPALDSLSPEAKQCYPPAPIEMDLELPAYKKIKEDMKDTHGMPFIVEAQAIKDATMANSILKNFQKGQKFLHYNGSYHSNNFEGMVWFLKKANPKIKILTIASEEEENIDKLSDENKGLADYIIVIPSTMTKTY